MYDLSSLNRLLVRANGFKILFMLACM